MKNKKTYHLGVRLTPEKIAIIKERASRFNLPVSWWIRMLINQVLEQEQEIKTIRLP